jgi:hypothetical protein
MNLLILLILVILIIFINIRKFRIIDNFVQKKENNVDFICIGVQKGGTCSLHNYLNQHKDIKMYPREIHYFDNRNKMDKNTYLKKFNFKYKIVGEKSPSYITDISHLKKIYDFNPNIKIIILFRDPISRFFSHINHSIDNKKYENISFDDIFKNETSNIDTKKKTSSIKRGYYDIQLENVYKIFPKKNIYIGISEEIKNNKQIEYNKILNFLGVESIKLKLDDNLDKNVRAYNFNIKIEDEKKLFKIYNPHIENLYKLLGKKIDIWEEKYKLLQDLII